MSYRYQATKAFWENFYSLPSAQKESARRAWKIFKQDPFDPRLRTHKIQSLSAHYGRTIYAVEIEGDCVRRFTSTATWWFRWSSAPTTSTSAESSNPEWPRPPPRPASSVV